MASIDEVLRELRQCGQAAIQPGTAAQISDVKKWQSCESHALPPDYVRYLTEIGECRLHGNPQDRNSFVVRMLPLGQVENYVRMTKFEMSGADGWYAIADLHDGNFIVMDLATVDGERVDILDGCWETLDRAPTIAKSFTEFLSRSLADPRAVSGGGDHEKGTRYWSTPGGFYGEKNFLSE